MFVPFELLETPQIFAVLVNVCELTITAMGFNPASIPHGTFQMEAPTQVQSLGVGWPVFVAGASTNLLCGTGGPTRSLGAGCAGGAGGGGGGTSGGGVGGAAAGATGTGGVGGSPGGLSR